MKLLNEVTTVNKLDEHTFVVSSIAKHSTCDLYNMSLYREFLPKDIFESLAYSPASVYVVSMNTMLENLLSVKFQFNINYFNFMTVVTNKKELYKYETPATIRLSEDAIKEIIKTKFTPISKETNANARARIRYTDMIYTDARITTMLNIICFYKLINNELDSKFYLDFLDFKARIKNLHSMRDCSEMYKSLRENFDKIEYKWVGNRDISNPTFWLEKV